MLHYNQSPQTSRESSRGKNRNPDSHYSRRCDYCGTHGHVKRSEFSQVPASTSGIFFFHSRAVQSYHRDQSNTGSNADSSQQRSPVSSTATTATGHKYPKTTTLPRPRAEPGSGPQVPSNIFHNSRPFQQTPGFNQVQYGNTALIATPSAPPTGDQRIPHLFGAICTS